MHWDYTQYIHAPFPLLRALQEILEERAREARRRKNK